MFVKAGAFLARVAQQWIPSRDHKAPADLRNLLLTTDFVRFRRGA